jgi:hypothetical protein
MRKLLLATSTLAAGTILGVVSASAMPVAPAPSSENGIENARLVCNAYGRCWNTRGYHRYGYYPRRHYYRGYGYYGPRRYGYAGPSFSFSIGPRYGWY